MVKASHDFQVFVKPTGSLCNLGCVYCYYLEKENLYPENECFAMPEDLLEEYIIQHIEASPTEVIRFSWHGGEPTLLGLEFYRKVIQIQRKHKPRGKTIANGIQTNGTLLDDDWGRFLAGEGFAVGLSLDGPQEVHDQFRTTKDGKPSFEQTLRGYNLLRKHGVFTEILCVVNAHNVEYPMELYRFFKDLGVSYLTFLPLVDREHKCESGVSSISVPSKRWGEFLCTIFDEWLENDIGRIKVQIFEEAIRTAFNQEHSLCIFRPICGDVPVVEHNGDFYSCDQYVDAEHLVGNIKETHLGELLENKQQIAFGRAKLDNLPHYCRTCSLLDMCNGGCPKNRFINTPDGEPGLNYLCEGYKIFFNHCKPFISQVSELWRKK
jgi:uncharacterized protein